MRWLWRWGLACQGVEALVAASRGETAMTGCGEAQVLVDGLVVEVAQRRRGQRNPGRR